jgi:hypothetical protein
MHTLMLKGNIHGYACGKKTTLKNHKIHTSVVKSWIDYVCT